VKEGVRNDLQPSDILDTWRKEILFEVLV